jgi:ribosomal protein S18 acetylase RimI-like enzyme
MFAAMGHQDGAALDRMAEASTRYMERALPAGEFRAWVVEAGPEWQVIACGGLVIRSAPPSVRNLAGREGYIMNLVTLPAWQRQGIATAVLRTMLDALRAEGVPMASLHASRAGRALYEREGFQASNEMRLALGDPRTS